MDWLPLGVALLALGCGGLALWTARNVSAETVTSRLTALTADNERRWAAVSLELQAAIDRVTEVATDAERRRRRAKGAEDAARRWDEEAAAQPPQPADEMEAARARLRARGVPFSG